MTKGEVLRYAIAYANSDGSDTDAEQDSDGGADDEAAGDNT
jgi:hypothetical protein